MDETYWPVPVWDPVNGRQGSHRHPFSQTCSTLHSAPSEPSLHHSPLEWFPVTLKPQLLLVQDRSLVVVEDEVQEVLSDLRYEQR